MEPGIRILALSIHSDKRFVIEMLNAGALGYLVKDCAFEEVLMAIRAVADNKSYIAPKVLDVVVKDYLQNKLWKKARENQLSLREAEVLRLIAGGRNTKEIASELCIGVKTVETHRLRIMEKLDLHNVADLTKYAIRIGLIDIDS